MARVNILDDLNSIKKIDTGGMLHHLFNFPQQCRHAKAIGESFKTPRSYSNFDNIVLSGLGGSAIGADLARSFVADYFEKPIYVNRNYTLPGFVNYSTILFCLSYSGNTEETISSYYEGRKKNAKMIILTSGGRLSQLAENDGVPCITIPGGLPPRQALGYSFFPPLYALLGLSGRKPDGRVIDETIAYLLKIQSLLKPERKTRENPAKKIALKLYRKIPIIYGAQNHMDTVVLRFRNQLEENSKHISFSHIFPEMNHNEIVGWENPKALLKDMAVVFFRDRDDHSRTQLRMDITKTIISKYTKNIIEINSKGNSLLSRMFYLIYLGDFISFYLAILNRVDPTPVEKVKYLKDKLAKIKMPLLSCKEVYPV